VSREIGTTVFEPEKYPEEIRHLLKVCGGECKRITRPSSVKKALAPDTVTRQGGNMCQLCLTALGKGLLTSVGNRNEIPRKQLEHTLAGLGSYMARRNERLARRRRAA
jgi:hypothetical protein